MKSDFVVSVVPKSNVRPPAGESLTVPVPSRRPGGRRPPVHAGGLGNEEDQVSQLEETALLQTTGGLRDHLVQVQKGGKLPLHMYEHMHNPSD